jgi:hypothetical protein
VQRWKKRCEPSWIHWQIQINEREIRALRPFYSVDSPGVTLKAETSILLGRIEVWCCLLVPSRTPYLQLKWVIAVRKIDRLRCVETFIWCGCASAKFRVAAYNSLERCCNPPVRTKLNFRTVADVEITMFLGRLRMVLKLILDLSWSQFLAV